MQLTKYTKGCKYHLYIGGDFQYNCHFYYFYVIKNKTNIPTHVLGKIYMSI